MRWAVLFLVLLVAASSTATASTSPDEPGLPTVGGIETLDWLAMGDSYSSGQGLIYEAGVKGEECQRAPGTDPSRPSAAWAPLAAMQLTEQDLAQIKLTFVACEGAISDDAFADAKRFSQIDEALRDISQPNVSEDRLAFGDADARWDVVSFTFGGNNVGFSDVIKDCLGFNPDAIALSPDPQDVVEGLVRAIAPSWLSTARVGCDVTEEELEARIDMWVDIEGRSTGEDFTCRAALSEGGVSDLDDLYSGAVTLPELLDAIGRCVVRRGGLVLVMGYPRLFADPGQWHRFEGEHCSGFHEDDVAMLNRVTGYLNEQVDALIDTDNGPASDYGVEFVFVDPQESFEMHGLCNQDDQWINDFNDGLLRGRAVDGMYHPNQDGYDELGRLATEVVRKWLESRSEPIGSGPGLLDAANALCRAESAAVAAATEGVTDLRAYLALAVPFGEQLLRDLRALAERHGQIDELSTLFNELDSALRNSSIAETPDQVASAWADADGMLLDLGLDDCVPDGAPPNPDPPGEDPRSLVGMRYVGFLDVGGHVSWGGFTVGGEGPESFTHSLDLVSDTGSTELIYVLSRFLGRPDGVAPEWLVVDVLPTGRFVDDRLWPLAAGECTAARSTPADEEFDRRLIGTMPDDAPPGTPENTWVADLFAEQFFEYPPDSVYCEPSGP